MHNHFDMKRIPAITTALLLIFAGSSLHAQEKTDNRVTTPNYALAERFSAKAVNNMVFSTQIVPNWFRDSDKFWYSWKTSDGTKYYIVDPAVGTKSEIFDMDRLAMQLTEIVKDPFDAKHIPFTDLKLKEDKYFLFDIRSTADTKDEEDSTKTVKKVFHFKYDISSKELTVVDKKPKEKYPRFASVSPDGMIGVYVKNYNLYAMDTLNMRKAVKDPKDSTIVEKKLTFDGKAGFSWGGGSYSGDQQRDTTVRSGASSATCSTAFPEGKPRQTSGWQSAKMCHGDVSTDTFFHRRVAGVYQGSVSWGRIS
jgi:hypothetical protein